MRACVRLRMNEFLKSRDFCFPKGKMQFFLRDNEHVIVQIFALIGKNRGLFGLATGILVDGLDQPRADVFPNRSKTFTITCKRWPRNFLLSSRNNHTPSWECVYRI